MHGQPVRWRRPDGQGWPARRKSRSCTPRLGNCWWNAIFWRKPPVDERGLEAIEDRDDTPASVDRNAMPPAVDQPRSEEHTSELQSLMRISYAVFSLKKKKTN